MNTYTVALDYWREIPGWMDYHDGIREAVAHFPSGSRFCEVGLYLGLSICALACEAKKAGKQFTIIGVDTCRGTGVENGNDNHCEAVGRGGGTFAGELHRNLIACGVADSVQVLISDSVAAAALFPDGYFDFVNLDARHDYESVKADIRAWKSKVRDGGWLCGDDLAPGIWDGVVQAVNELLPTATPWAHDSWRYCK